MPQGVFPVHRMIVKRSYEWTSPTRSTRRWRSPRRGERASVPVALCREWTTDAWSHSLTNYPRATRMSRCSSWLEGAPSHRSDKIVHPQNNVSLLKLAPYSPELDSRRRGGLRSPGASCPTGYRRASLKCKRRSPSRWRATGKSPCSSKDPPDTPPGGWRRWRRDDINGPERYYCSR